jgi:vitamin B12 transporter
LYGSDAVAGVINLITKTSGKKPFGINANISAGSYQTYNSAVSLSGNGLRQSFFISYNKIKSRGFSSAYDSTGKNNFEKDGFNQDVFQLNYTLKPFKKTSFRVFGKYNKNRADLDAAAFSDDSDYTNHNKNLISGAVVDQKIKKGFIRLQYSYNHFKRNFLNDSTDVGGFSKYQNGMYDGTSHFAELYSTINFTDHIELLAGADLRRNSSSQLYIFYPDYGFPALPISADSAVTKQLSFYTSVMLKQQKGLNLELGGRFNHHNIYGTNFTYSVNPFYIFSNHYKLYGSVSSGYRVPSIYQLYSEFGNKKLRPEVTTNFEAGVQYSSKKIDAKLTGFIRQTSDVFYFYTDPVTFAGNYINADQQKDFGVETEVAIEFYPGLSVSSNYSYVDGRISTRNYYGKDTSYFNLYKRPKNVFNISLNFQVTKDLFLSTSLKTVSKAVEPPSFQLKGYYTLGFYAQYDLNKYFSIFADGENITNQKYFVTRGFTTKGFHFNAGARFKW